MKYELFEKLCHSILRVVHKIGYIRKCSYRGLEHQLAHEHGSIPNACR